MIAIIGLSVMNIVLCIACIYISVKSKQVENSWKRNYELLAERYRKSRDEYWDLSSQYAVKSRKLFELEVRK
jgi:hypothetical protein